MTTTIYTIGYEKTTIESFLKCLLQNHISEVLDIRELPLSRMQGFSKTRLRALLESHGVRYRHVRALGCPRQVRYQLRETGEWEQYVASYMHHLNENGEALDEITALTHEESVALLCFERDATRCHRSIVAERVQRIGNYELRIAHLHPV